VAYVTQDQIERARETHVLDYVERYELNDFRRVSGGYRHKENNEIAVNKNGWYCHYRCTGGVTALDYLVEIKDYGLVDAVCEILGERPYERGERPDDIPQPQPQNITPRARSPTKPKPAIENPPPRTHGQAGRAASDQPERLPFSPPLRYKDNKRVIAYLQSRGIDRDLIMDCINQGSLYENAYWHNAVFLGKDENGKTRFAAMRSTNTRFFCDAEGSDKKYGFRIPPDNPESKTVAVYESPIDCLSHQTLCKQGHIPPYDGWRLSLGCVSLVALEHLLEQHPEINHCIICTDNDDAGEKAALKIAALPGITTLRSRPAYGKDWNDTLQAIQKAERTQNKARCNNAPNL
jgi:hypothetical protein